MKQIVASVAPNAHVFMPVQTGFGAPDLDFIISVSGYALRIETKVVGKRPTERQELTIRKLKNAGVPVLIIDQTNLIDVFVVLDYLRERGLRQAFEYANNQRECYAMRCDGAK